MARRVKYYTCEAKRLQEIIGSAERILYHSQNGYTLKRRKKRLGDNARSLSRGLTPRALRRAKLSIGNWLLFSPNIL